jgi:hypothetical protein
MILRCEPAWPDPQGIWRAWTSGMNTWVVKRFWTKGECRCVLFQEGSDLELRVYERGRLVALRPCDSVQKAVELATVWYDYPPSDWPPY